MKNIFNRKLLATDRNQQIQFWLKKRSEVKLDIDIEIYCNLVCKLG